MRLWWRSSAFRLSLMLAVRSDSIRISRGSTYSMPYTRLKWVSLVLVCGVVRLEHNTVGSSSTQQAFIFPSCFLRHATIVWLDTSVCPLACGCAIDVKCCLMFCSLHQSLKCFSANYSPWSLIRTRGVPNLERMFFHMNLIMLHPITEANGSTSIHFVK